MVKRILPLVAMTVAAVAAYGHSPALLGLTFSDDVKASFPSSSVPVVEPGRLYVKIRPGKDSTATKAISAAGGRVGKSFTKIGWKSVTFSPSISVDTMIAKLAKSTSFMKVEPSYKRYFLEVPNDPKVPQQWSIPVMRLNDAWGVSHGDPEVTVCVIDSGFDTGHPDYAGVLLTGKNFGDGDVNDLTDIVGHGTHTSGTVGAATNNGIGIAGNAYGSKILPYKVATADGGVSHDGLINAIIAAGDAGAPICSISIGGYGLDTAEEDAINYSSGKGTLFIVSAGNDNTVMKSYPAAFEACVAVGATDKGDVKADFSNYGADWVDVAAPGVDILSLWPRSLGDGTGYMYERGTSMAAPNVAGVAALILSTAGAGELTREQLRSILENNCDSIGTWIAHGRVNAYRAVLATPLPLTDPAVPTDPTAGDGTLVNVDSDTLSDVDGITGTIQGVKKPGVGWTGSMSASFPMTKMTLDQLKSGTLSLSVQGDRLATLQVYFRDSRGKWVLNKSLALTGATQTVGFKLDKAVIAKYMEDDSVEILVRALLPTRLASTGTGVTQIDRFQMTYQGKGAGTPTP